MRAWVIPLLSCGPSVENELSICSGTLSSIILARPFFSSPTLLHPNPPPKFRYINRLEFVRFRLQFTLPSRTVPTCRPIPTIPMNGECQHSHPPDNCTRPIPPPESTAPAPLDGSYTSRSQCCSTALPQRNSYIRRLSVMLIRGVVSVL